MTLVALVDDHELLRTGLAAIINSFEGYKVILEANNGKHFIEKVDPKNSPDIILLDITLPKMNGMQVLEAIMAVKPKQPIIMLSSNPEEVYGEIARSKGAACYIEKTKQIN